jgi:hypothetical protein
MTDPTQVQPPLWQRVLGNQRFLGLLTKALAASGFLTVPLIQKWFPDVTPQSASGVLIEAASFLIGAGIGWYRDHPDNILARALKQINGGTASPAAVAKIAAAVS